LGNNIISINEDKKGNIWIGTDDGGLNRYNTATQTFTHYFNNDSKKPDLRVIFIDKKVGSGLGKKVFICSMNKKILSKSLTKRQILIPNLSKEW